MAFQASFIIVHRSLRPANIYCWRLANNTGGLLKEGVFRRLAEAAMRLLQQGAQRVCKPQCEVLVAPVSWKYQKHTCDHGLVDKRTTPVDDPISRYPRPREDLHTE